MLAASYLIINIIRDIFWF